MPGAETNQSPQPPQQVEATRNEDFASLYANNVRLETNVFDCKLIFGEISQHTGKETVQQHTAISLSWPLAKLLVYYLQVTLAAQELQVGKIQIPARMIPAEPLPLEGNLQTNELAKLVRETILKMRAEFLEKLK